jgi:predicted Fe-S protein YdhL (DUF1289 family)
MTTAGRLATATGADDVASPCISVCEMSPHNGFCLGCYRTLDEIAAWSMLDVATRRAIVDALPARRAMAERPC